MSLRECGTCGARFVHPLPRGEELRDRYQDEHASGKWRSLFRESSAEERRRRATLVVRHARGRTRRILDVGFGDGSFLDEMTREGWRALGVEVALAAALGVADRHPVLVGSLDAVRSGAEFGAVTFWDVLEHVPDPGELVEKAVDRLTPGGVVAVTMPNLRGTESLVYGRSWRYYDLGTYGHLHHLSVDHVTRLLEDRGLTVVYRETRGSVDLRHVPEARTGRPVGGPLGWLLDRASGLLARIAEPAGRGNTLLVVGRKP